MDINIRIFIYFVHCLILRVSFADSHIEHDLRAYLFRNYSSYIRPVKNPNTAVNVTFNIKLMQVLSVDERDQKVTTQSYYAMRWINEFLSWDPKDWGNISLILVKPEKVWIPDIILKNNADSTAATVQENTDYVWLHPDGRNAWYPKLMLTSSFKADVKNFPFDKQKFIFHFGSWSLGEEKLLILKDEKPMIDKYYVTSTEWKLLKMEKSIVESPYDTDRYSEIVFKYVFSRKPSYCVITAILPCIMLMSIVLSSYLLPPNCGERIGVLITAILAFTVFLQVVNASLPRNSDSIPILKLFYLVTMGECTLCFLASCLAIRLLNKKYENNIPFLPGWITRYLCQKKSNEMRPILPNPHTNIICYTGNEHEVISLEKKCKNKHGGRKDSEKIHTVIAMKRKSNLVNTLDPLHVNSIQENISKELRQNDASKKRANEIAWKQLVEYLDRICLYVFFLLFLMTSSGILLPACLSEN